MLLSINIDHPEVDNFITAKDKKGEIEGANISVKVTDSFMEDLKNDVPKARKIWNKIVHQAHKSAEPGLLFIDTIKRESPADCYKDFETVSTNPCGSTSYSFASSKKSRNIGETFQTNFRIR